MTRSKSMILQIVDTRARARARQETRGIDENVLFCENITMRP